MKTGLFWSKSLYNLFSQYLGLEAQFERSDDKSNTKYDKTTKTYIKEGGNYGNGKLGEPDLETVDPPRYDVLQVFL